MKRYLFVLYLTINVSLTFAQGFICAIGGGSEDYGSWSDEPYSWIVQKADSGKIYVLSYSDQTNWIPDYLKSLGAKSVENIKIPSRAVADQQDIYDNLITAKAVFIKGGDQWQYVNYWKGTKTEEAIKYIYQNGGVIAGTSAGAMVLGDVVFTAKNGSAYSRESLINPFNSKVKLDDNFINLVPNVIFDTHFIQRGRFGRLIAFMFNSYSNIGKNILGIGIDDETALCIDNNMIGRVFGSGSVSIFQKDSNTKYSGINSEYIIENLRCDQLLGNWSYDLINKKISEFPESVTHLNTDKLLEFPKTDIWLSGNNSISNNINNGLANYLYSTNSESIGLIINENYEQNIIELTDYFDANNIHYNKIPISESTINEPEISTKIQYSTCFIVIGDDLKSLSLLADASFPASEEFSNKINIGTPIYGLGSTGKIFGDSYINNADRDKYASYYGAMTNNLGLNIFGDLIFQPMIFENSDFYENRTSALLLGLMRNRKKIGIYCDGSNFISINKLAKTVSSEGELPIIIVDARNTSIIDSSHYATRSNFTRQTVGMDNLRYTISKKVKKYSLEEGKLIDITSIKPNNKSEIGFVLSQNYPNPFNPNTQIQFNLPIAAKVNLSVYNIIGQKVTELTNNYFEAGLHSIQFTANNLSSGLYFYKFISDNFSQVNKMILLK
ncbi:MAG: Type 1 glutamine amidotransferase-like domain-containing protein [Labilibaculum sp.]|nr:Type 1 glutamine amidotransferase-like domain-containing protein [Labilibaculum sp.]MBI9060210.1 Type 1 glutamine amidotransferase-like domain-containing protein [Labilibaculum sp.]